MSSEKRVASSEKNGIQPRAPMCSFTTHYSLLTTFRDPRRSGYTFVELLLVIGIIAILGAVTLVNLANPTGTRDVTSTAERIAALLREAQSRSVSQASSTSWGVRFDNGASPFYALYGGTYATSSREAYYALPATVGFSTSTIAADGFIEISFAQRSGSPAGSSTVGIYSIRDPATSSTISVASSGMVSY